MPSCEVVCHDTSSPAGEVVMTQPKDRRVLRGAFASALTLGALAPTVALADESGISFWVPGFFGSLAATPQQPGWSLATIYYHTTVSAGSDVALAREFQIGRVPANLAANLNASLNATILPLSFRAMCLQPRCWAARRR
jgi:hypothetical protein